MSRKLIIILLSGCAGALIAWLLLARSREPQRFGTTPEKFVPAQTLHLQDATGQEFAELNLGSDRSVEFDLADADQQPLLIYQFSSKGELLTLEGVQRPNGKLPFIEVLMSPGEPRFTLFPGDGREEIFTASKGWRHGGLAKTLAIAAFESVFPNKPEHTIENTIPTEDVRLVDREGHAFAACGLSEGGEPGFALQTADGRLVMSFALSASGYFPNANEQKEWPTVLLFDSRGKMRVMVELGPETEPLLTLYENTDSDKPDIGVYVLDPQTGREIPKQHLFSRAEGMIPWLRHKMFKATLPIRLIDQRGEVIWNSTGNRVSRSAQ